MEFFGEQESNIGSVKPFQIFQKLFAFIAIRSEVITPSNKGKSKCFNLFELVLPGRYPIIALTVYLFCFGSGLICLVLYLHIEADTFEDYVESFYSFTTAFGNGISAIILFLNRRDIFSLIDSIERIIQKSEFS